MVGQQTLRFIGFFCIADALIYCGCKLTSQKWTWMSSLFLDSSGKVPDVYKK